MTSSQIELVDERAAPLGSEWWRTAVIYQIYPRSFADSSGDGVGDLPGITSRLDDLTALGVDALWLSPFQRSPQKDAGYDVSDYCDVDPLFGTLADFDEMLAQAHSRGIRLIIDLVPNHSSDQHRWFQEALAAAPGSPERARYLFREGRGVHGELPPNNWESVFGGPAWTRVIEADGTPGQWYLHLFDSTQPDFDWSNPAVREEFRRVLRFWLDRGVDGFRVDVAHGLVKAAGLPDYTPDPDAGSMGGAVVGRPVLGPGRRARDLPRLAPAPRRIRRRPGTLRRGVAADPRRDGSVGALRRDAPGVQLLVPFDRVGCRGPPRRRDRVAAGLRVGRRPEHVGALEPRRRPPRVPPRADGREPPGSRHRPARPSASRSPSWAWRRARAATTLMLALPGSAYLYQGEELGLPEVIELDDHVRQDPTWFRTAGERYGRDGCRVPIPWSRTPPRSASARRARPGCRSRPSGRTSRATHRPRMRHPLSRSTVRCSRCAARAGLGAGSLEWLAGFSADVLAFRNGNVTVIANVGDAPVALPDGIVIASSGPVAGSVLPADTAVWLADD